jgi:hypothetical protein
MNSAQTTAPEPTEAQISTAIKIRCASHLHEIADIIAASEAAAVAEWKEKAEHYRLVALKSDAEISSQRADLAAARARETALRDEIQCLRIFGNKDCTAMADAVREARNVASAANQSKGEAK